MILSDWFISESDKKLRRNLVPGRVKIWKCDLCRCLIYTGPHILARLILIRWYFDGLTLNDDFFCLLLFFSEFFTLSYLYRMSFEKRQLGPTCEVSIGSGPYEAVQSALLCGHLCNCDCCWSCHIPPSLPHIWNLSWRVKVHLDHKTFLFLFVFKTWSDLPARRHWWGIGIWGKRFQTPTFRYRSPKSDLGLHLAFLCKGI